MANKFTFRILSFFILSSCSGRNITTSVDNFRTSKLLLDSVEMNGMIAEVERSFEETTSGSYEPIDFGQLDGFFIENIPVVQRAMRSAQVMTDSIRLLVEEAYLEYGMKEYDDLNYQFEYDELQSMDRIQLDQFLWTIQSLLYDLKHVDPLWNSNSDYMESWKVIDNYVDKRYTPFRNVVLTNQIDVVFSRDYLGKLYEPENKGKFFWHRYVTGADTMMLTYMRTEKRNILTSNVSISHLR